MRAMGAGLARVAVTLPLLVVAADDEVRAQKGGPAFRDVANEWKLDFRHHHGGSGERFMVETMVGGVLLFDYDGDGDDDALMVDGGVLPGYEGEAPKTRLFRNDLIAGDDSEKAAQPHFVDVTDRSGLAFSGYGCGGAVADIDGDGWLDVYLTAYGHNALFRNLGDGRFESVEDAATAEQAWSASAAFADVDGDSDLDLYVTNYVDWSPASREFCGNRETGVRGYCHPGVYRGVQDRFYRNQAGRFEDATQSAGFAGPEESGLGVVFGDVNADGRLDVYVANDLDPNLLFLGVPDGRFEDHTLLSGTATAPNGQPEAGMGVELADLDGDLRPDLVVTNFALETNALYRNAGGGVFIDRRFADNLAEPTLHALGFGVAALDVDLDGDLDLVFANGHILDNLEELGQEGSFEQRNQLLLNDGGRFAEAPDSGLSGLGASRGLAVSDLDLDGALDLVIVNSNAKAEVYAGLATDTAMDTTGEAPARAWLIADLEQSGANRYAIGAEAILESDGLAQRAQLRLRRTASSYLSQNGLGLHFAAGSASTLRVRWPLGERLELRELLPNRRYLVRRTPRSLQ